MPRRSAASLAAKVAPPPADERSADVPAPRPAHKPGFALASPRPRPAESLISLDAALQRIVEARDSTSSMPLARLVRVLRPHGKEDASAAVERVRMLTSTLARRPDFARALAGHLETVFVARYQRFAFAESGILANEGFAAAVARRIGNRFLPEAPDERFLSDLVAVVFHRPDDYEWLDAVPDETWDELRETLARATSCQSTLRRHFQHETMEALRMLSQRLAAIGLSPEIVRYYPALAEHESPFLAQNEETIEFVGAAREAIVDPQSAPPDDRHVHVLLQQCLECVDRIRRRSRVAGVSVRLTYLLTRIEQIVARMSLLAGFVVPGPVGSLEQAHAHTRFLIGIVREENRRHRVGDLVRTNVRLVALQITEHASRTGEHYIAESRAEYWRMFRAAVGAGFVVSLLALVKVLVATLHLAPLWEGLLFSLNYGVGFVVVHLLNFTIATKQPAMTAAALAVSLDRAPGRAERLDVVAELSAKVCRTQWIAIVGNVVACFAASLAVSTLLRHAFSLDPIGATKAAHVLADLNPVASWAVPHAALAGVYLFLAGLVSGYYDNKAIYNRVPERLRRVEWLQRVLGRRRLRRVSRYLARNLGALAGMFVFGFMLGGTSTLGWLVGLPVDPRHVTFATANLAYALATPGAPAGWQVVGAALAGLALIGLTNVGVSFALAMRVALRSRGLEIEDNRELARHVLRRLRERPGEFFRPPAAASRAGGEDDREHGR